MVLPPEATLALGHVTPDKASQVFIVSLAEIGGSRPDAYYRYLVRLSTLALSSPVGEAFTTRRCGVS